MGTFRGTKPYRKEGALIHVHVAALSFLKGEEGWTRPSHIWDSTQHVHLWFINITTAALIQKHPTLHLLIHLTTPTRTLLALEHINPTASHSLTLLALEDINRTCFSITNHTHGGLSEPHSTLTLQLLTH